jgi:OHCU decarboxylase
MPKRTIADVNRFDTEAAVALLGGVFERSPWIVRETWAQAPFGTVEELHAALCATIQVAGPERQLALIRAHPDLVGRAARAGTLTKESTGEQRAAGLGPDDLTPQDVAAFARFNTAYKARFGFPFVICARENRRATILAGFETRLRNDPDSERATALREIERIGWYRLLDLVDNDPVSVTTDQPGSET